MAFLGKLVAGIAMFFSSLFGLLHAPQPAPTTISTQTATTTIYKSEDTDYTKNAIAVFRNGQIIPDADPNSFYVFPVTTFTNPWFAKDNKYVYYNDKILLNADVATFAPLKDEQGDDTPYAKDKNSVWVFFYQDGSINTIAGADPGTFVVMDWEFINDPSAEEGADLISYAKDKNHVYTYTDNVIAGADPVTFVLATSSVGFNAQDKNHQYLYGQIVK